METETERVAPALAAQRREEPILTTNFGREDGRACRRFATDYVPFAGMSLLPDSLPLAVLCTIQRRRD